MTSCHMLTWVNAGRRMIKLGLSIDEDEPMESGAGGEAEELPPLEETADEGSRMEEVD